MITRQETLFNAIAKQTKILGRLPNYSDLFLMGIRRAAVTHNFGSLTILKRLLKKHVKLKSKKASSLQELIKKLATEVKETRDA